MAIPAKLEELILEGKARFETYQAGFTEFNVIPVQSKEFVVITGFTFLPAPTCYYNDTTALATIQRIEFFDGNNYSHHIAKMTGSNTTTEPRDLNELIQSGLYLVFHNDVGVMVTVPIDENVDLSPFRDTIDGSNGNTARKVINQGTNPYLTAAQSVQYGTESGSAGTFNIPGNRGINDPNYTNSMTAGPHGVGSQETNQFQFTAEPGPVTYGATVYSQITPTLYRRNWYLNIQYVRVFNSGTNVR
tara:strand:+ start:1809 stop:2546 length:738 start_codon:yes stop_codon:yes gene_type:complete